MTSRAWFGQPVGALAVALVMGSAGSARADQAQSAAAAEALINEGHRLLDQKKYADACPKLAASQKLDPGAGTLLNLGDCYEKNGQTASAWATYLEAVTLARSTGRADWAEKAKARAAALEPSLSRLTIVVPPASDVAGLSIERDGVPVDRGAWGSPIPVDPGAHPVVATAPKKQQWSTTAAVGPNGARVEVTIPSLQLEQTGNAASPTDRSPQPARTETSSPSSTQRTVGIVLGAAGVVGLAVGGVFALKAKSTYNDARTHCAGGNVCTAEGVRGVDDAHAQATVSTIAVIGGTALLAGGLVLFLTAPAKEDAGRSASVSARPLRGGGALSLGGAF
jgi:hypothetical protein